jgi:glyoxylase-like metal-dependent hydrolase (beta-lactamase superfamily II)
MNTKSGQILISAIHGNRQQLDGGAMFGNVPRPVWQKWLPPDEVGRVELQCRALLVQTPSHNLLCETGIGAFFEPKLAERFGVIESEHMLLTNLAERGLAPEDIDYIILSHLHFDHAGGLLPTYAEISAGHDTLAFPRAKFLVGEEAFARCKYPHERDRASFIPGLAEKLERSGRLIVIRPEAKGLPDDLTDLISFRYSNGHTPGQMHCLVQGQTQKVFFAGDLIPGLPWVHLPVTMGYDRFPERLIDEKKELYQAAIKEDWYVFFTHDIGIAMAKIESDQNGKFLPKDLIANPVQLSI